MSDADDRKESESRRAVLARRARFVAAALAGAGIATSATACPCLEVVPPPADAGAQAPDAGALSGEPDAGR